MANVSTVDDFASYFHLYNPIPRLKIEEVWTRIITVWNRVERTAYQDALLPKNLVFAVLYMLHVETKYAQIRPRSSYDTNEISSHRWRLLTRFDTWVHCTCEEFALPDCGSYWNYCRYRGLRKIDGRKECVAQIWLDNSVDSEPNSLGEKINEKNWNKYYERPGQLPRPYIT